MQNTTTLNSQEEWKTLKLLSPVYAGRSGALTAALQYVFQAITLSAQGETEKARALESLAGEKLRHLQLLGSLVEKCGAKPVFTSCPPYPVSYHSASYVNYAKTYPAMLAADIELERSLCVAYTTAVKSLEGEAKETVAQILQETRAHLETVKELDGISRA